MGLNKPVNFSTAKLLKKKGFDKRVKSFYDTEKELHENYVDEMNTKGFANRHLPKGEYSAPTIAEAVMWLYKKHGVWIHTNYSKATDIKWMFAIEGKKDFTPENSFGFNSPIEAYKSAIKYCLEKII